MAARPADPYTPPQWVLDLRARLELLAATPPQPDAAAGVQQLAAVLLEILTRALEEEA